MKKPTGSISLGAGYSSADGLGFTFGFQQENAFGTGNSLGLQINTSSYNRTLVVSSTDPYFTEDGVSRSIDLYERTTRPYTDVNSYAIQATGGSLRFGVPFTETDTVTFGAGFERTEIIPGTLLPDVYETFANQYGLITYTLPLTVGWARDTRDSGLLPSTGRTIRLAGEWSPAGDLNYARGTAQVQQFFPVSKKTTLALNAELDYGVGTNGQDFPVLKNYYSGGLGSVRGFEQGSLTTGQQRLDGVVSTGGAKKITFNAELLSPLPGGGNDRTLRWYTFFDAGGIYGPQEAMALGDMRMSAGIGISWVSPVGPLRLSYAQPVRQFDGDRIQSLQFQIGTSF